MAHDLEGIKAHYEARTRLLEASMKELQRRISVLERDNSSMKTTMKKATKKMGQGLSSYVDAVSKAKIRP